jgi:hypothetical protein
MVVASEAKEDYNVPSSPSAARQTPFNMPEIEPIALLGPQRFRPTVAHTVDRLGLAGPLAVITAGWQDREAETEDLEEHLQQEIVNLELYRRAEDIGRDDAELSAALRQRQSRMRRLQRLYGVRLDHCLAAARELLVRQGDDEDLEAARRDALEAVRSLDEQHLQTLRAVHRRFEDDWEPPTRESVRRHREEIQDRIAGASALVIAGGHVAVLINRLRLFGALELAADLPIVAWSAGAMVLAERIVLFHDSPPQGAGNAEVLDAGLNRLPGVLPLPDAKRRLRLEDPLRVSLFSRRFAPLYCVLLDEGAELTRRPGGWESEAGISYLGADGKVTRTELSEEPA